MVKQFSRLRKLAAHPGFQAEPFSVLWRAALWAGCVATHQSPVFALTPAGERLKVEPNLRHTSVTSFILRDWCEPELRILDRFLRPGDVFIDVGANIGLYTLKGARLVGQQGAVVALEPGRLSAERLTVNLALNEFRNVQVIRKAASDTEGTALLHHVTLGHDVQAYSLAPERHTQQGETVETITLDRLVSELRLDRVDCIKIDVEGAEAKVLAGSEEILRRWKPILIIEVNSGTSLERQNNSHKCWDMLAALGYRFHRIKDDSVTEVTELPNDFGNLIASYGDSPSFTSS